MAESKPRGPDTTAMRKCLTCGERFLSAHIGNRICNRHKGDSHKSRGIKPTVFMAAAVDGDE